jgi:hypothetical protein
MMFAGLKTKKLCRNSCLSNNFLKMLKLNYADGDNPFIIGSRFSVLTIVTWFYLQQSVLHIQSSELQVLSSNFITNSCFRRLQLAHFLVSLLSTHLSPVLTVYRQHWHEELNSQGAVIFFRLVSLCPQRSHEQFNSPGGVVLFLSE